MDVLHVCLGGVRLGFMHERLVDEQPSEWVDAYMCVFGGGLVCVWMKSFGNTPVHRNKSTKAMCMCRHERYIPYLCLSIYCTRTSTCACVSPVHLLGPDGLAHLPLAPRGAALC